MKWLTEQTTKKKRKRKDGDGYLERRQAIQHIVTMLCCDVDLKHLNTLGYLKWILANVLPKVNGSLSMIATKATNSG